VIAAASSSTPAPGLRFASDEDDVPHVCRW